VPHGLIFYHFKTKMDLLLAEPGQSRLEADAVAALIARGLETAGAPAEK
jgi:hypothetical protein